jgi:para-nitrobenzyl esterase
VSIIMVPIPDSFAIDIWNGYIGGLIGDSDEAFDAMTEKYIAAMPEVDETRAKEQLQTDALYRVRALKAADLHSDQTKDAAQGKTYAYQFNYKSPTYPEKIGAMHGMDLVFGWGHFKRFPTVMGIGEDGKVDPAQQKLADGMLEALANFARTGVPSSDKLPEWPEYETGARNTMVFDAESKVVSDPGGKLRKLWE